MAVPLPQYDGDSYAVIEHKFIIDGVRKQLKAYGLGIRKEEYKMNEGGQIAQGIYHLDHSNDEEMGMMFAWSNSYNKKLRFRCAVGASVYVCDNGMLSGDMGSFGRIHTGDAKKEALEAITGQIQEALITYAQMEIMKVELKMIYLNARERAEILGRLFLEESAITLSQLSVIKQEIDKPTYNYGSDPDCGWTLYNHITHSLKQSHPLTYIRNHGRVFNLFLGKIGELKTRTATTQPKIVTDPTVQFV